MRALLKAGLFVVMAMSILASVVVSSLNVPARAAMATDWPESVSKFVLHVRKMVKTTDMEGYLAVVKTPNGVLLLDVREDAEFKKAHVPGAVNIPRGLLEFRIWKQLGFPSNVDLSRKIFVQCQTGGRATLATKQLQDIGFTNVTAVIMNFDEWQKKGNPLSKL